MLGGLLAGWIASWFGFIGIYQQAMHELFNLDVTSASYWFLFVFLGYLGSKIASVKIDK